ncbi:hypothetical protein ENUP19_0341G0045 [Entamoeba nuttalli]|uniref:Condensin complex subunit 2 n=1 Tax=Entamoeba nuttalli TaxID=412467 RepID=A0ABQ0DXE6_9EUKA
MNKNNISELYAQCIQLCNTNKVNKKNAWDVPIIDLMQDIINENDDKSKFQRASTSIDASLLIYSYRVDDIYQAFANFAELITTNQLDKEVNVQSQQTEYKDKTLHIRKTKKLKLQTLEKYPANLINKSSRKSYQNDLLFKVYLQKYNSHFLSLIGDHASFLGDWNQSINITSYVQDDLTTEIPCCLNFDKIQQHHITSQHSHQPQQHQYDFTELDDLCGEDKQKPILGIPITTPGYSYYNKLLFKEWYHNQKRHSNRHREKSKTREIDLTIIPNHITLPLLSSYTYSTFKKKEIPKFSLPTKILKWSVNWSVDSLGHWDDDIIENDSSYDEVEDTFIDNGMKSCVTEVTTRLSQSRSQWNIIQPPKQFNTNPLQCVEHQKILDYPTLEQCVQSVILNSNTKTISFETIYNQTLLQLSSKLRPEATIHYVFVVTLILSNKKQYHLLNPSLNQLSVKVID